MTDDGHRKVKTFNDVIEDVLLEMYEDPGFRQLLASVADSSQSIAVALDQAKAAVIIRDKAIETGRTHVADKKLAEIVKALRVVLRRYGIDATDSLLKKGQQ
jgi:hypothetical protein